MEYKQYFQKYSPEYLIGQLRVPYAYQYLIGNDFIEGSKQRVQMVFSRESTETHSELLKRILYNAKSIHGLSETDFDLLEPDSEHRDWLLKEKDESLYNRAKKDKKSQKEYLQYRAWLDDNIDIVGQYPVAYSLSNIHWKGGHDWLKQLEQRVKDSSKPTFMQKLFKEINL